MGVFLFYNFFIHFASFTTELINTNKKYVCLVNYMILFFEIQFGFTILVHFGFSALFLIKNFELYIYLIEIFSLNYFF